MFLSNFEPANGHLMKRKMFNGRDNRRRGVRRVVKMVKPERKLNMTGNEYKEPKGETNYPKLSEKRIFGMRPKTIGLALGIIAVSIFIISKIPNKEAVIMNQVGGIA